MRERIDFAAIVRHLLAQGRTTASIAAEIGCTQPTVSRLANGVIGSLSVEPSLRLLKLAGGHVEIPSEFVAIGDAQATAGPASEPQRDAA